MYEFWSYNKKIVLALGDEQFANTSINKEQNIYKVYDEVKRDAIKMIGMLLTMILQRKKKSVCKLKTRAYDFSHLSEWAPRRCKAMGL